jgi:hypothetical protein
MRRTLNCLAVICFSLISLGTSAPVGAQEAKCPAITVDCPTVFLQQGELLTVTASLDGADPKLNLSYNWTINAGVIVGGQGTSSITVGEFPIGETFTATLEISGLDPSCQHSASCSLTTHLAPQSRRFDKFGDLAFRDEKKRLDYFAEQLKNEPGSQGYIMVYGKRGSPAGDAQERAARAKEYLVTKGGVAAERLVTLEGGDHDRLSVELWLAPQGARPPTPVDQYGESPDSN